MQSCFNFSRFDSKTSDLKLAVSPPDEFELPIFTPAN
jgi:hypothetical protein